MWLLVVLLEMHYTLLFHCNNITVYLKVKLGIAVSI